MRGIELSRAFYEAHGKEMLKEFEDLTPYLCVGLVGAGSECFGFDDEISQDHDFEPGFCIFVPEEKIDRKRLFALERAYAKLPEEFMGYRRQKVLPVGGNRHGVMDIHAFYEERIGKNGLQTAQDWFMIPETFLAEATNGEIFFDNYGEFTKIRRSLERMPMDVWLKKTAGETLLLSQTGEYNYARCLKHGQSASAQLCLFEFVKHALSLIFLLNHQYAPYYKWSFRALADCKKCAELGSVLETLITTDNQNAQEKERLIETVVATIVGELKKEVNLPDFGKQTERYAYALNDQIKEPNIRNLNVLYAVD